MATNGRKRYFNIDEKARSEPIQALLDDVESADEDDINNVFWCALGHHSPPSPQKN